ncbi:PadR family transcriptional regulator [Ectobacillus panaciterrae]|uniref:PadR family transcriptional regulator n=1 Tax=Ectobacillus panaciterrae TaxID=363872 RepID=UPI000405478E|nr:PadR family transcriptional regulator [Ectobacillus panaciterrae]
MSSKSSALGRFSEPTLFILISLANENKHGYAIMEDIEKSYDMKIGPGTLYGAISRMEKTGLIEAIPSQERRQPYQITPDGREYLQEKLKEMERITTIGLKRLGLI